MARLLANFTANPLLGPGRHFQSEEYRKPRRCVKMTYASQTPVMTIKSFSGLRSANSVDLIASPAHGFFSKINFQITSRKGNASRCVTKAIFERFTEKAIKVIMLSQDEARRLGHNFMGTEQILLGLIGEGTGIAAVVLRSMGINLKDTRVEVEKIVGRGSGFVPVEIPFTPLARRVVELSLNEAGQLGHNDIGTEHLLLGLVREGEEGVAARVLENLGVDASFIRTQVLRMVGETMK
ncbi:unnamed protein product [Eruca vesicaria subsp. sativa]|uniref:Clp R domain-containing protein n=1 Tax=Eruca vesicaria subsp. sativa TaxID=29727 RepID=A0ABC8IRG5_ERUVS|nr:unnamed protein product [Eruca vesicaria subsp. sativa]